MFINKNMVMRTWSTVFFLMLCISTMLTGCSSSPGYTPAESAVTYTQYIEGVVDGHTFYSNGYQIKMTVTPKGARATDALTFEVFVDGDGAGKGLLGYKDDVYTVHIQGNGVYVLLNAGAIVKLSDLDGHMVPGSNDVLSSADVTETGFSVLDGEVTTFQYSDSVATYSGEYAGSSVKHEQVAIASDNVMSLSALIDYSLSSNQGTYVDPSAGVTETPVIEKESMYLNDTLGVTIHNRTYSVGDYCNPKTYFEEMTPEGLLSSIEYNEDKRVEMQTITYVSSDGRTAFMTTDGYVQIVSTTCPFIWHKISNTTTEGELKHLLGIGLSRDEESTWTPMLPDITEVSSSSTSYVIKYGNRTVTISVDRKTSMVSGIVIENYLAFLDKGDT